MARTNISGTQIKDASVDLAVDVAGVLPVANGGTNVSALSSLLGTSNQVIVSGGTNSLIGGNVTLSLPQNIATTSTPTFGQLTLSTSGVIPTIYGSTAANGDITIEGTSHATKTSSYVVLQPTGGGVIVGTTAPVGLGEAMMVNGFSIFGDRTLTNPAFLFGNTGSPYGVFGTLSNHPLSIRANNTDLLYLTPAGNLKVAGAGVRGTTEGTNHIDIFNSTAPAGTLTNGISIYSASGVPTVMDASGNANGLGTTSTPQFARIGLGMVAHATNPIQATLNAAALGLITITNSNSGGTAGFAGLNDGGKSGEFGIIGSGRATYGALVANDGYVYTNSTFTFMCDSATGYMKFATGGNAEKMRLDTTGNLKIAGTATRATTEGTNHLDIFNGTAPAGALTNGISLYSTSGELRVMDAAGNATLLSPHDRKTNEWIYDSVDTVTGKRLTIQMERLMKAIDKQLGGGFIKEFMVN